MTSILIGSPLLEFYDGLHVNAKGSLADFVLCF